MSLVGTNSEDLSCAALQVGNSQLRIAIVGCGPRGLQCLETISHRLALSQLKKLHITMYEPSNKPGSGRIYDPSQSHVLKMNLATQYLDFSSIDAESPKCASASFIKWLSRHYPEMATPDQFVPRAIMGEYLNGSFATVWQHMRQHVLMQWNRRVVRDISQDRLEANQRWIIDDGSTLARFDHVVVSTGHEGIRGSGMTTDYHEPFVFPVERQLSRDQVPAGSIVFMRGFGLTSIDAILMLTEGREGQFIDGTDLPVYVRSLAEPKRIDVYSRSGRPMLAKPTAGLEPIRAEFWLRFKSHLRCKIPQHGNLRFQDEIWCIVLEAAAALLSESGQSVTATEVSEWYRKWSSFGMDFASARQAMLQSYLVAIGRRPKDIAFALGEAWRKLYPEIVELISYGGLNNESWCHYQNIRREMERIAFGPPACNVGKILAIMREGILRSSDLTEDYNENHMSDLYDIRLNAVLAAPHEFQSPGLIRSLIASGVVQIDKVTGAVRVDKDGGVGPQASGLYIFGRATEGWVIGNDTLSRTLHQQIENWAETIEADLVKVT